MEADLRRPGLLPRPPFKMPTVEPYPQDVIIDRLSNTGGEEGGEGFLLGYRSDYAV